MKKLLDLSQTFYHNNPGALVYELCEINYESLVAKEGYTSERINMNTHTSTHFDAPTHHFVDGLDAAQYPIDKLVGEAVPIDLFDLPEHAAITPAHLEKYEKSVKKDDILLLCTGFGYKRAWTPAYVDGWTYLSAEGAQWAIDHGVKGIAIDCMSVGGPRPEDESTKVHRMCLEKEIWFGEELFLPRELLEETRWRFAFLPLKIEGASGAPGRAIAWID